MNNWLNTKIDWNKFTSLDESMLRRLRESLDFEYISFNGFSFRPTLESRTSLLQIGHTTESIKKLYDVRHAICSGVLCTINPIDKYHLQYRVKNKCWYCKEDINPSDIRAGFILYKMKNKGFIK